MKVKTAFFSSWAFAMGFRWGFKPQKPKWFLSGWTYLANPAEVPFLSFEGFGIVQ